MKKLWSCISDAPRAAGARNGPRSAEAAERPEIAFEDVGFVYPGGLQALEGVSFRVPYGQTVALVGENGAGKTTLVKLLLRFYDPSEGRILVGGVDLRELDLAAWRRKVGAVFQRFGRYAFTLGENVGLADLARLDDAEALEAALRNVGLGEVLVRLPRGLATPLGRAFGGRELPGGEWQRLAIARALFREAEVLVLDEPTAALDARAEHRIFSDFARLARGRTALLVSHRLASVREADRILVLKTGRLVEDGTHDELLAKGGRVRRAVAVAGGTLQRRRHRVTQVRREKRAAAVFRG